RRPYVGDPRFERDPWFEDDPRYEDDPGRGRMSRYTAPASRTNRLSWSQVLWFQGAGDLSARGHAGAVVGIVDRRFVAEPIDLLHRAIVLIDGLLRQFCLFGQGGHIRRQALKMLALMPDIAGLRDMPGVVGQLILQ